MAERLRGSSGVKQRLRRLKAEPLCRICKAKGIVTASTVPDHITPLAKGGTDEDSNIRCLCGPCHDAVTREEFGLRPAIVGVDRDGWPVQPDPGPRRRR